MLLELENGKALIQKTVATEVKQDESSGQILAMISTSSVDSDQDVIHQVRNEGGEGWQLDRFNKHPAMLWMHDHTIPSIGAAKAYIDDWDGSPALFAEANFDQEDPFAKKIEGKVRRGYLFETSVGFMAEKYSARDEANPFGGFDIFQQELIEFSWVNRGANPDVESFVKSAIKTNPGIKTKGNIELVELKAEFEARLKEIEASIKAIIQPANGEIAVDQVKDQSKETLLTVAKQIADTQARFRGEN